MSGVSQSRFYMWRAIFAMAHADHEITRAEQEFMSAVLMKEKFSSEQSAILKSDIEEPKNPGEMFMQIAEQEDRSRFFYYARMLCWCDGKFDEQEQEIMLRLKRIHVRNLDMTRMLVSVDIELADNHREMLAEDMRDGSDALRKFLRRFKA